MKKLYIDTETQTDVTGPIDIEALLKKELGIAPAELVKKLTTITSKFPHVFNEALIVNLANSLNNISMYGREVNDVLTDKKSRKTYHLHPYRKAGSGADCMPTYTHVNGDNYVLLGKKKLRPNETTTPWILLGGYFQPHPLVGHEEIEKLSDEEKDQIEELLIQGYKDAYEKFKTHSKQQVINKEPVWDKNIEGCAKRELKEEANLDVSEIKPHYLRERSEFPDDTPSTLHTIAMAYLFNFGVLKEAPSVQPGSDIAEVRWVNFKDLKDYKMDDGVYVRTAHQQTLEKGAEVLLDQKINDASAGLLTLKTLQKHIEKYASFKNKKIEDILEAQPQTYLGIDAQRYAKKLVKIANLYRACYEKEEIFNLDKIEACLKSETSLLSSFGFVAEKENLKEKSLEKSLSSKDKFEEKDERTIQNK